MTENDEASRLKAKLAELEQEKNIATQVLWKLQPWADEVSRLKAKLAELEQEKNIAIQALWKLQPWADRVIKLCESGDCLRHTCLDGCGPVVMESYCGHGVLRYPEAASLVLKVLEKLDDKEENDESEERTGGVPKEV